MIEHTQEPWTMGKPPYHGNEIHGVDRADGSRQLVAQVYGYSREEVVANMRRITACVNACAGIPTETLEAGVVVVPVEVAREYVESHRVPPTPNAAENQRRIERAIAATQRLDEHLAAALSRLQQNWEQPAETRITVTIDVQTWQGYHDRRVIEVEPGIGWPERMAPEVLKAALEMEEQFLRRGLQQNGGEGR